MNIEMQKQQRRWSRPRSGCMRLMLPALTVALITGGCASTPIQQPEAFQAFSESLEALHAGTDRALAEIMPLSESRFKRDIIEELGDDGADLLESLQLATDATTPFKLNPSPLFLKTEQFKLGTARMTSLLVDYSKGLVELADPELLSQQKFDTLATDLNANAFEAINTMNVDSEDTAQRNVALFSQIAIASTQSYLRSKQRSELIDALSKNQLAITNTAEEMQHAILTIAQLAVHEYSDNYIVLARKAVNPKTRKKAIEDLITLDRDYLRQIKALEGLHQAFGKVPAAHQDLVKVVNKEQKGLASIIAVIEAGKRLQAGYDQVLAANKAAGFQARADAAASKADALEAEAKLAALRFGTANLAAIQARQDAQASPDDTDKQRIAEDLESDASALRKESDEKKAQAQALREAADLIQQQVDALKGP